MDQHIERILRQIPGWSTSDAVISSLVGGITNQNYRVDIGEESFVLRIGGKGTHLLGIDRERESICTAIAAISPETAAQPETLRRIVDSMRRYHIGPAFPGTFSPFETVRNYHKLALTYGVIFPGTLPRVFALMAQIEEALAARALDQTKSCHNDLLASNFIDDGRTIWILDWEYAGMGDIFFDLGNFAVNQSLNDEQCALLLHYYFGEVRPADLAHLHLMRLGSDLRESFWGFIQLGISELDFDYREYAHHHLNRFLHNVETSPFEQWLRDVKM